MNLIKKMDKTYDRLRTLVRKTGRTVSFKRKMKLKNKGLKSLTKEQRESINAFWSPYCKITTDAHIYYSSRFGEFCSEFIPDPVYYNYIDKYYNNAKKAVILENKCYFQKMFPGVAQPETVCYRINGFWYNSENQIVDLEQLKELVDSENVVVTKQAAGSYGGYAVKFIDKKDGNFMKEFLGIINNIKEDIIVQRPIKQHAELARLNSSSVNSLRVVSLLKSDGNAKVYSVVLRMGVEGMRVDNASSGGVNCGVLESGYLRAVGHTNSGGTHTEHPTSGVVFAEFKIPNFEKVMDIAKKIHTMVPDFRLVSWDFAIGEDGEPILIEANLNCGGINVNQANNGPLFGSDTKEILDEVFNKSI